MKQSDENQPDPLNNPYEIKIRTDKPKSPPWTLYVEFRVSINDHVPLTKVRLTWTGEQAVPDDKEYSGTEINKDTIGNEIVYWVEIAGTWGPGTYCCTARLCSGTHHLSPDKCDCIVLKAF